jgi:hypothetical protein
LLILHIYCTALHCTALHCTALHCTALHCTALLQASDVALAALEASLTNLTLTSSASATILSLLNGVPTITEGLFDTKDEAITEEVRVKVEPLQHHWFL